MAYEEPTTPAEPDTDTEPDLGWSMRAGMWGGSEMIEPFSAWVDFQEQMIRLQREQLEAAKKALEAGSDMVAAQRAAEKAAHANMKAWKSWLDLWMPKK